MSDKLVKDMVEEQQDDKLKIKLSVQELNIVLASLQEMPHKAVDGLIRNIYQQAQEQAGN